MEPRRTVFSGAASHYCGEKMNVKTVNILSTLLLFLCGCASFNMEQHPHQEVLKIKGSDSMLLLTQRCAAEYMKSHPGISMYVEGGGSKTGIDALINGTIDICAASRPLLPSEVQQLAERYHSLGIATLCAKDALGIVVHPSNPVDNLSIGEVKNIFTGKITRWSDVGGTLSPITSYSREPNSGTYLFLQEHILLDEPYSAGCEYVGGARALIDAVAADSSAIGYSTFVYAQKVKLLSIGHVAPTIENVRNGTYPISRYLYFYTVDPPAGLIKSFIEWTIGPEGQRVIQANGYIPLYESSQ